MRRYSLLKINPLKNNMKTLSCSDLGTPECDFVAKGANDEEVIETMMDHAKDFHSEKIDKMAETMSEDEMRAMMMDKIKEE